MKPTVDPLLKEISYQLAKQAKESLDKVYLDQFQSGTAIMKKHEATPWVNLLENEAWKPGIIQAVPDTYVSVFSTKNTKPAKKALSDVVQVVAVYKGPDLKNLKKAKNFQEDAHYGFWQLNVPKNCKPFGFCLYWKDVQNKSHFKTAPKLNRQYLLMVKRETAESLDLTEERQNMLNFGPTPDNFHLTGDEKFILIALDSVLTDLFYDGGEALRKALDPLAFQVLVQSRIPLKKVTGWAKSHKWDDTIKKEVSERISRVMGNQDGTD